jgi:hypothetical protein
MPYIYTPRFNNLKSTKNNVIDSIIKLNKINAQIKLIEQLKIIK